EQIAHLDCRAEQTARVVAEVEDESADSLLLQLLEGSLQFGGAGLGEVHEPDVADLVFLVDNEIPVLGAAGLAEIAHHAGDLDDGPGDGDVEGLVRTVAGDRQYDLTAGLALDQIDGLAHALRRFAIDLED